MSTTRLGFTQFLQQRFNNNGNEIARELDGQISRFLESYGVDWEKVHHTADFNPLSEVNVKEDRHHRYAINPKQKGSISLWFGAKQKNADSPVIPYVTVNNLKIGSETWTAYDDLKDLHDREQGFVDIERQRQRQAEMAQREQAREAKRATRLEQERIQRDERQAEHEHYRQLFVESAAEEGSHPYLVKKQISDIIDHLTIRRMADPVNKLDGSPYLNDKDYPRNLHQRLGDFIGLSTRDIEGDFRGLQRLYESTKLQTVAVESGQFKGAFIVIGDLETAEEVGVCEGFATGASVFLAHTQILKTDFAMVVAISANNMAEVCRIFKQQRPDITLTQYTDNDCWKEGNTGRRNALEISKAHGYKAILPTFDGIDENLKPNDFNDIHCHHPRGLKEVARQLKARSNRLAPAKSWFEFSLQKLALANKQNSKTIANAAINAGMGMVPLTQSTQEVIDAVCMALPKWADVNHDYIKARVIWMARIKLKNTNATRAFSNEALAKPHVNVIKVQPEMVEHDGKLLPELPSGLQYTIQNLKGPVILRAPMGTGKTKKVIQPLMKDSMQGAYLAHRTSLVGDATNSLSEDPATVKNALIVNNYQDMDAAFMPAVSHLACCVNSIIKNKFAPFMKGLETLCIDEAAQTLQHICEGKSIDQPVRVLAQLIEMMRSCTGQVLLCDADANDSLIELCELARPGETINIIEMDAKRPDRTLEYDNHDNIYQEVLEAVAKGEKVYVTTDSAKQAEGLAEQIRKAFPGKKCLSIYSENKSTKQVDSFLRNPNEEAIKYDVVTASPAISSGLSITVKHFDQVFGLFHGVVSPSNAMQMLARIRKADNFIIGLKPRQIKRETDRARLWRGIIEADKDNTRLEETPEQVALVRQKLPFDELRIRTIADENKARFDFANHILLIAAQEGWKVKRRHGTEEQRKAGAAHRKLAIDEVRERGVEMRLEAEDIDEMEAYRIDHAELKTEDEAAKLDRYNIKTNLCIDQVSRDDVEFWQSGGMAQMRRFELLQANREQANNYDQSQRQHGVAISNRARKVSQHQVLHTMFTMTGLNLETGAGVIDPAGARQFIDHVSIDDGSLDKFNQLKLGPYIDPLSKRQRDPIKLVQAILENIGLTTVVTQVGKARLRRRSICPDSWQRMMDYYQNRQQANVWSLDLPNYSDTRSDRETALKSAPIETLQPASPVVVEVGAGLNKGIYTIDVNPLITRYPAVMPIIQRVTAHTSIGKAAVLSWLDEGQWEKIQMGRITEAQLASWVTMFERQKAQGVG